MASSLCADDDPGRACRSSLERIARHRQRFQTLVRIKETGLSGHHRLRCLQTARNQARRLKPSSFPSVQLTIQDQRKAFQDDDSLSGTLPIT